MTTKKLDIINKKSAISIEKDNGTLVDYFLFKEFEVHYNKIPANCVQDWHSHHAIKKSSLLLKGI